jgi:hypothetical protein
MSGATLVHYKAMLQVMNYCVTTADHGLELKVNCKWMVIPSLSLLSQVDWILTMQQIPTHPRVLLVVQSSLKEIQL